MCGSPTAGDVTERAWKLPNELLWTTSTITTGAAQVELVTVDGCHVRVSNCCCFLFTSTSTHVTHNMLPIPMLPIPMPIAAGILHLCMFGPVHLLVIWLLQQPAPPPGNLPQPIPPGR